MIELDDTMIAALIDSAKEASKRAYCPYSDFPVGAAVMSADGNVFSGCNVENASFGLTICGERNALFQMVGSGKIDLIAIAIYTPTSTPTAPCGACRQVLNEFGPEARVISACDGPARLDCSVGELLPQAFGPKNLR